MRLYNDIDDLLLVDKMTKEINNASTNNSEEEIVLSPNEQKDLEQLLNHIQHAPFLKEHSEIKKRINFKKNPFRKTTAKTYASLIDKEIGEIDSKILALTQDYQSEITKHDSDEFLLLEKLSNLKKNDSTISVIEKEAYDSEIQNIKTKIGSNTKNLEKYRLNRDRTIANLNLDKESKILSKTYPIINLDFLKLTKKYSLSVNHEMFAPKNSINFSFIGKLPAFSLFNYYSGESQLKFNLPIMSIRHEYVSRCYGAKIFVKNDSMLSDLFKKYSPINCSMHYADRYNAVPEHEVFNSKNKEGNLPFKMRIETEHKITHPMEKNIDVQIMPSFDIFIPDNTKDKINDAAKIFGNEIYIIKEAKYVLKGNDVVTSSVDPLVIGIKNDKAYLIDLFDPTPLEKMVADKYIKRK
ncbi:MAG: hypothetical protein ACP5N1_06835 [Candidatus Woesearchaeota archaeon]